MPVFYSSLNRGPIDGPGVSSDTIPAWAGRAPSPHRRAMSRIASIPLPPGHVPALVSGAWSKSKGAYLPG